MKRSKLKKLIKKLKALAERGVGGEAVNAQSKLDALLKKHNIKLDDVSEFLRIWELTTLNESSVILEKVIHSVAPDSTINVKRNKSRLTIEVALSDEEYMEVKDKYRFIWAGYNSERQTFIAAFFNKNSSLFIPDFKKNKAQTSKDESPAPEPPPVDLKQGEAPMSTDEQKRVGNMMLGLRYLKYVRPRRKLGDEED